MRTLLVRLTPAFMLLALMAIGGMAEAREWPQIIQCVWEGPNGQCG